MEIIETQKLRRAIWAIKKALQEAANTKQEHLAHSERVPDPHCSCLKKVVVVYVTDLREIVEIAERYLENAIRDATSRHI